MITHGFDLPPLVKSSFGLLHAKTFVGDLIPSIALNNFLSKDIQSEKSNVK